MLVTLFLAALMASTSLAAPVSAGPLDNANQAVDQTQQAVDDVVGQNPADGTIDGAQGTVSGIADDVGGTLGGLIDPVVQGLPPRPDPQLFPPVPPPDCPPVAGMDMCDMPQPPSQQPPTDPGTSDQMPGQGDGTDPYGKHTVSDTDDDAHHRARFTLDRNWALTGASLSALSRSGPEDTLVYVQWAYDDSVIGNGPIPGVDIRDVATRAARGFDAIRFRPLEPGLHHVTLTGTWVEGGQTFRDRVTTPLYVEDPAIAQVHAENATAAWSPDAKSLVDAALSGDPDAVAAAATDAVAAIARPLGPKPTILLLSDFLGKDADTLGLIVGPDPKDVTAALAALPQVDGLDPSAGFGDIAYDGDATGLGAPVDRVGLTLTHTLVDQGLANVVFVSAIDARTGALDRRTVQNGLLFAQYSGIIDAVVWGLPSSAYEPAVVLDSMRPDFNFAQTPMAPLPATSPLPAASPDWHTEQYAAQGDDGVNSIMDSLNDQAALLGLTPQPGQSTVADLLYANMDRVYARYRILVETVRNDLKFDAFLQQRVLDLGVQGVPFVVPSEECPGMEADSMTLVGVTQVVGAVTVAAGTAKDGPDAVSCKGPDRRAAAHGNGIDFVTDPRPARVVPGLAAATATDGLVYVPNSLGAALQTGLALGGMHKALVTVTTPYAARDLAGMLATGAKQKPGVSTWWQGDGFVDALSPPTAEPALFARGTGLVFSPFDLQNGRTRAVAEIVITGRENVAAAMAAPSELWTATGRTEFRFLVDEMGNKVTQDLATTDYGHLGVTVESVSVNQIDATHAEARLVLSGSPSFLQGGGGGGGGGGNGVPDAREYLMPGLYSGRTWISTPTGIIQLPINIGVGTILDVHRFLAPNTAVPETAVCLEPPFKMIGDLTGLRHTAHELEELNICIYFTNTDEHGVARFYTPLPLPYTLTSWFDGIFRERGDGIGAVYPHVKRTIMVPSPLNVSAVTNGPPGVQLDPGITSGSPPTVAADLPYPLAYIPLNVSIPVAIAVHWRYRDNQETDHFLPVPEVDIPEFVYLLTGGIIPHPLIARTDDALRLARDNGDGTLQYADEHIGPILDGVQDKVKAPPTGIATVDQLLGQPISKALPTSLAPDPSACQWGYGNQQNPALTAKLDGPMADPMHTLMDAKDAVAEAQAHAGGDPAWFPDTLVMRARPSLDSLLGLGSQLPVCMATYPFNIPQPNTYPTFITDEFDLHLEASILVVCVETVADVECFVIVPGPDGIGNQMISVRPDMLVSTAADAAAGAVNGGPDRLEKDIIGAIGSVQVPQFDPANPMANLPTSVVGLPSAVDLTSDGRVSVKFEVNAGEGDHGYLHYIAIPLPVLASGYLDPLVAALQAQGIDPLALLNSTPPGPDGTPLAGTNPGAMLRNSVEDLMRVQPYVEISRADMFLNAWWWTDSFFDARIFPTVLLPRSAPTDCLRDWSDTIDANFADVPHWPADPSDPTCRRDAAGNVIVVSGSADTPNGRPGDFQNGDMNLGEDFWWLTHPNVNLQLFERGRSLWDPYTLQPDPAKMAAAHYPWAQAEFFENVLEFWDDENVRDVTPNEMHIHSPDLHTHHAVEYTKHCTNELRHDTLTGRLLNDPATGQYCFKGLLAYNEGDHWLENTNTASGSGVYDPDLGLDHPNAITFNLIDTIGGGVSDINQLVWATTVPPLFGTESVGSVVGGAIGIDPSELKWWSRGEVPTANRRVYSDMYTNSSFMLSEHDKYCEEIADFETDNAFLDLFPRWKMTCPWQASDIAKAAFEAEWLATGGAPRFAYGFVPDDAGAPRDAAGKLVGHWDWLARTPELGTKDPHTQDKYARMASANAYQDILNPVFLNGTYERRDGVYSDCMGNMDMSGEMPGMDMGGMDGMNADGWPCNAMNPMDQATMDLAELDVDTGKPFADPIDPTHPTVTNPFRFALKFYGLDMMSQDENFATVPLPSNPDHWFGTDPDATEWNGFFRNLRLRQIDWDPSKFDNQQTDMTALQDEMTDMAPLLRAWLDGDVVMVRAWYANAPAWFTEPLPSSGPAALASATQGMNPFWADVHGQDVPYGELTKMRMSSDPEMPMCDGIFFLGGCRMQHDNLDTGDLSLYGKGHLFGRTDKPKMTYIPQGSTFSRWNRVHLESVNETFTPAAVHAHGNPAMSVPCGSQDGRIFWILAPSTVDLTADGWKTGPAPPDDGAAPSGYAWYSQPGIHCVPLPWESWGYWAEWTSPQPTGGSPDDLAVADKVATYYERAGAARMDPNDPLGMARQVQTTYDFPDPAAPHDGTETGCWFDPTSTHSSIPHVEMDTFDVRFLQRYEPYNAGHYHHVEPGHENEPVPATPFGAYCPVGTDQTKARFERESIPLRLPVTMNGGDPGRTLAAPVTQFQPEKGTPADVVGLGIGSHLLPKLVRAVLADAVDEVDSRLPHLDLHVDQTLRDAEKQVHATVPSEVEQILENVTALLAPGQAAVATGGSPVRPLLRLDVKSDATVSELLVEHIYAFPPGTEGIFVSSQDEGQTWQPMASRGAPGFVGSTDGKAHIAYLDLAPFAGQSLIVGSEIVGAAWANAQWNVLDTVPLAAGLGPLPIGMPYSGAAGYALEYTGPADDAALAALSGTGGAVLLKAPLDVPAGTTLALDRVDLVGGDCADAPCGITVEGVLDFAHGTIAPQSAGPGMPVQIFGELRLADCRVGGVAAGLQILGGTIRIDDCWLVGTGAAAIMAIGGQVEVTRSVISGQSVGVYATAAQVRLEGNLFARLGRTAAILDESWGVVRGNVVVHTKQAAFLWRSPLGGSDLAFLGNALEDTGTGIGATFALEDRIGTLDPRRMDVPVASRTRLQGNEFQWNTLEALGAGPLSAPVAYGNAATHSDIGVLVGWLDQAVLHNDTIYTNENGWQDAQSRTAPRQDGNLWTGLWHMQGPDLKVDASRNYWGPGSVEGGMQWPSDLVVHNGQVDASQSLSNPAHVPIAVALTAPGYGGGVTASIAAPSPVIFGSGQNVTATASRSVPVMVDVGSGVTEVTLRGSFYASGLPSISGQATLDALLGDVGFSLPADPSPATLVRTGTQTVQVSGSHAAFAFAFDDAREEYADWQVVSFTAAGAIHAAPYPEWATKSVRVHNSVTWPFLSDISLLVQDLTYDTLNETLAVTHTTAAAQMVPTGAPLASAGLPIRAMADTTVPLAGTPGLVALARDQDPVRLYEFRYTMSNDAAGTQHSLGAGYGMDRVLSLPPIPEGATLQLEGRATDASGLTSPWTGIAVLTDRTAPAVEIPGPCISNDATVHYWAADHAPEGSGLRASGLGQIRLRAERIDDASWSRSFKADLSGDAANGTWKIPDAKGGLYKITAAASDLAGQAGTFEGVFIVDAGAPIITVANGLATLESIAPTGGYLGAAAAELLGPAPGKDLPLAGTIDDQFGCGIAHVNVDVQVGDGEWQTKWSADYADPQPTVTLPADLALRLDDLEGQRFAVRIQVDDAGNNHVEWATNGTILPDYGFPVVTLAPAPPICSGGAAIAFEWGASEAVLGDLEVSQLQDATLRILSSGAVLDTIVAGFLPGAAAWNGTFTFTAPGAGVYTFVVTAHDRAGNEATLLAGPTIVDTMPPDLSAGGWFGQSLTTTILSANDVAQNAGGVDLIGTAQEVGDFSCGLANTAIEVSEDHGATWQPIAANTQAESPATVAATLSLSAYDGQRIQVRLAGEDLAGNAATWPAAPHDILIDTTPPAFVGAPSLPSATPSSFTAGWSATDPPGAGGEASGLAWQMWELIPGTDATQSAQSYGMGGSAFIALDGLPFGTYTLRLTLGDHAGNTFTWHAAFAYSPFAPPPAPDTGGGAPTGGSGPGGSGGSGGAPGGDAPGGGTSGDAVDAGATATEHVAATSNAATAAANATGAGPSVQENVTIAPSGNVTVTVDGTATAPDAAPLAEAPPTATVGTLASLIESLFGGGGQPAPSAGQVVQSLSDAAASAWAWLVAASHGG